MTSIPLLNVTPRTSFGNWLWPSRRRQLFCAASSSLKSIASAVLLDRQPFDRIVRWRTVAKVLSMGLVVRRVSSARPGRPEFWDAIEDLARNELEDPIVKAKSATAT